MMSNHRLQIKHFVLLQEKTDQEGAKAPNQKLEQGRQQMKDLAVHAGQVQRDCGLDIVPSEFCKETLKFGLMEVFTPPPPPGPPAETP